VFYAVDYTGTIWGIDVATGDTVLNAWFPGYDTGGGNPWSCYQLATDASRVYTIGANYDEDPAMPVPVRLVATDKADSTVLWDYTPQTTALPTHTECAAGSVQYAITVTDAGLLVTMQQLTDGVWTPTSVMLDPETGDVIWSAHAAVSATSGATFGIAVTHMPESGGAQFQVSPVNLTTGAIGAPLVGSPDDLPLIATGFSLAGQDGGNLVVIAQTMPADNPGANDTSILQVAGSTGALVTGSTVKADSTDLNACRRAQAGVLVCTSLSDPARGVGVASSDGKTLWQHVFAAPSPEPSLPLLFDGYLYGVDETGDTSFALDTATGQVVASGQYPQPIAVNGAGMVYTVPDSTTISGWRCLWAPATG